jgi:Flp pilus assembly protein TadD
MNKLRAMLEQQPDDPFLLYALAMEHKKAGEASAAIEHFRRVIQLDPGYCYAYHQIGLIHENAGDTASAKSAYQEGIDAAIRKGDAHAREEIEAALEMLG